MIPEPRDPYESLFKRIIGPRNLPVESWRLSETKTNKTKSQWSQITYINFVSGKVPDTDGRWTLNYIDRSEFK